MRVQRCLTHIKRNISSLITTNPKTIPHKILLVLAKRLVVIRNVQEADMWVNLLQYFHNQWGHWLSERTYRTQTPPENIPKWVRANQKWWYTHQNARQAYNLLSIQVRQGTLFTFLDPTLNVRTTTPITSNTNLLEGGANAQIKALICNYRGLCEEHMRRTVQWWCYTRSENSKPPSQLITTKHLKPEPKPKEPEIGPRKWDNAIGLDRADYHPDIAIWKGWAR